MDFTTKQKKASGEKNHDKRKENVIKDKEWYFRVEKLHLWAIYIHMYILLS